MGSKRALMESWQTPALRLCFEVIRCAWLTWEIADFVLPWAYFLPCFWQWEELGIKPSFPGSILSFINVCGASINKTVVLSSTLETAPRLCFALLETSATAVACWNRQIPFPLEMLICPLCPRVCSVSSEKPELWIRQCWSCRNCGRETLRAEAPAWCTQ